MVPLDAMVLNEFREPLTLIGNRFANVLVGTAPPTGSSATPAPTRSSASAAATPSSAASAATASSSSRSPNSSAGRGTTPSATSARGADRLDLKAIDADSSTRGDQAFDFLGDDPFSATPGELRIGRGGSLVLGDTDGDRTADLLIRLASGRPTVAEDDFIL